MIRYVMPCSFALAIVLSPHLQAQTNAVLIKHSAIQLNVTKVTKWEVVKDAGGKSSKKKPATTESKVAGASYTITIDNQGGTSYRNVTIKWAFLVKGEVQDGEETGSLPPGQSLTKKTPLFDVTKSEDVAGYSVDVSADGHVIASEQSPAGMANRIDRLRAAASPPTKKRSNKHPQ